MVRFLKLIKVAVEAMDENELQELRTFMASVMKKRRQQLPSLVNLIYYKIVSLKDEEYEIIQKYLIQYYETNILKYHWDTE